MQKTPTSEQHSHVWIKEIFFYSLRYRVCSQVVGVQKNEAKRSRRSQLAVQKLKDNCSQGGLVNFGGQCMRGARRCGKLHSLAMVVLFRELILV